MLSLQNGARVALGAALVFGVVTFSGGCEKKGPAETTGEKVDNAVKAAGDQADKAADKAADVAKDAGDKAKEAGDKASDAMKH